MHLLMYAEVAALIELREYNTAITHLTIAINNSDKYASAFLNRAVAYYHLGTFSAALKDINRAIDINSDSVEAFYNP